MKIAIVASEGAPYCKSGGLGDVMQALPAALSRIEGNEVLLILPYYQRIKENPRFATVDLGHFEAGVGWRQAYAGIKELKNSPGFKVWFIDSDYYFGARSGALYGNIDDGERFTFFSKSCLDAMAIQGWIPDVIQCNDWQTALVPVYLKFQYRHLFPHTKCMYTIHNIEYQGWANSNFFDDVLYLPWEHRGCMEMNGCVNMMKGAIETADLVTTVSETYARELMYPYYAHGLDPILANNSWKLTGITNGIDTNAFDPSKDPAIHTHYDANTLVAGKAANKAALQYEVGLPMNPDVPLLVMVTRLAGHKGVDLVCYILRQLMWEENVQVVVLGTGEPHFETFFRNMNHEFPGRVAAKITFDLGLASRIYAGGDIYLMPSKAEPCGLSQMNAMRYGTVPVVHATGGLRDTVPPCDENGEGGLGFTFQSYNGDDFYAAVQRAVHLYQHNRPGFQALQKRGMEQDFSWDQPAKKYMEQFQRMLQQK